jgi:hypothetical protein
LDPALLVLDAKPEGTHVGEEVKFLTVKFNEKSVDPIEVLKSQIKRFEKSEDAELEIYDQLPNVRAELHEFANQLGLYHCTRREFERNTLVISKTPPLVLWNLEMRQRFIKDTKIPIPIFEDPYWNYYMTLLDPYYQTFEKYKKFTDALVKLGGLDKYKKVISEFYDRIPRETKEREPYKAMVKKRLESKRIDKYGKLYSGANDGQLFISLDVISANFSAIKRYDFNIFGKNTWAEVVGTNLPFIDENKNFRQQIIGNLNAGQISILIGNITQSIATVLKKDFVLFQNDELVFKVKDDIDSDLALVKRILEELELSEIIRVSLFKLIKVGNRNHFIKEIMDPKTLEILQRDPKCIHPNYIAQVIKKYENKPIEPYDLVFSYEGHTCQYLKSVL